jgi:hypothetical protein
VNDPPTISNVADQTIDEDSSTGPIPFTVADIDTAGAVPTVTASSGQSSTVPAAAVVLGIAPAGRTISITPTPNENGEA